MLLLSVSCKKQGDALDYDLVQLPVDSRVRCIERAGDSIVVAGGDQNAAGFVLVLNDQLEVNTVVTTSLSSEVYDLASFQGRWYLGLWEVEMIVTDSLGAFPPYWWAQPDWVNTLHKQPFRRFAQTSDALIAICGGELAFGLIYQTYNGGLSWNPLEFDHELRALATWETNDAREVWVGGNGMVLHSARAAEWDTLDFRDEFVIDFVPIGTGAVKALTYRGNIWQTTDAGQTWTRESAAPTGVYANRMIPGIEGRWFIAANNGRLAYSGDEGENWRWFTIDEKPDLTDILVLDDRVVFTADQGQLVSIDLDAFQ